MTTSPASRLVVHMLDLATTGSDTEPESDYADETVLPGTMEDLVAMPTGGFSATCAIGTEEGALLPLGHTDTQDPSQDDSDMWRERASLRTEPLSTPVSHDFLLLFDAPLTLCAHVPTSAEILELQSRMLRWYRGMAPSLRREHATASQVEEFLSLAGQRRFPVARVR